MYFPMLVRAQLWVASKLFLISCTYLSGSLSRLSGGLPKMRYNGLAGSRQNSNLYGVIFDRTSACTHSVEYLRQEFVPIASWLVFEQSSQSFPEIPMRSLDRVRLGVVRWCGCESDSQFIPNSAPTSFSSRLVN
jgi:hypothetical protein